MMQLTNEGYTPPSCSQVACFGNHEFTIYALASCSSMGPREMQRAQLAVPRFQSHGKAARIAFADSCRAELVDHRHLSVAAGQLPPAFPTAASPSQHPAQSRFTQTPPIPYAMLVAMARSRASNCYHFQLPSLPTATTSNRHHFQLPHPDTLRNCRPTANPQTCGSARRVKVSKKGPPAFH